MKRYLLILLCLLASCQPAPRVIFDTVEFTVELATTPSQQSRGLMYRESLPVDQGMLFVFDGERSRSFWMKNTRIPLDMIFLDEAFVVVDVKHDVPPCETDPCPSYGSPPAKYVLEINAGLAREHGIREGSMMRIN